MDENFEDQTTLKDGTAKSISGPIPVAVFIQAVGERVQPVADALAPAGSCVVLTGEYGSGKSYIAQAAASAFASAANHAVDQIVIETFADIAQLQPSLLPQHAREESARILKWLATRHELSHLVILALGVDLYSSHEASVLEHLVRSRKLRIICTAHELSGAADRLARNPEVNQFGVAPLSIEESNKLLSIMLRVDRVTDGCLRRWHSATRGNAHALVTLALSAEKLGTVQRADRYAWVEVQDDVPPQDFVAQLGELTPEEYATLELVAYASNIFEPQILRLLDADTVTSLLSKQILAIDTDSRGNTVLATRLPIVADAIKARISPIRRTQLATICFDALNIEDLSTTLLDASRVRIVKFGVDSGRPVPIDWVWHALRESAHSPDFQFVLSLALAGIPHTDPQRSAEAILRACELAHFLGDKEALRNAFEALELLLASPTRLDQVTEVTRLELILASAYLVAMRQGDLSKALARIELEEQQCKAEGQDLTYVLWAHKIRLFAVNNQLREAYISRETVPSPRDLEAEFLTLPAQVFKAFIHIQRGSFSRAIEIAISARQLGRLHELPAPVSGGIESFAIFLAHWARGTTGAARRVLESLPTAGRPDTAIAYSQSGLIDLAIALSSVQEGRWLNAAELTNRTLNKIAKNDPFGVYELMQAIAALSRAVLGDGAGARQALYETERTTPGVSRALNGVVQILKLRTLHWLRDTTLATRALEIAAWAQAEELALIELEALDIAAHELAGSDASLLRRAEELAELIDQPIGGALLAHVQALTRSGVSVEPEERLLSELGVWLPLPPTSKLTGREREIALFISLGYPSKHVAERLFLSARTVETHLANVYTKLGLKGRESLRGWFSGQREHLT